MLQSNSAQSRRAGSMESTSVSASRGGGGLDQGIPLKSKMSAVFGKVVDGMDVVKYIEAVPKGPGDRPKDAVTIVDSGEVTFHTQVKDEL